MAAVTQESVVEDITSLLYVSDADERIRMIEELKGVLQRELSVATHTAINSKEHKGLERIDEIHGDIRAFFSRFKGVSTRWLHLYLGWYKWRRCFHEDPGMAAKQIVNGNYRNTWRSLRKLGSPFRDAFMNPLKS